MGGKDDSKKTPRRTGKSPDSKSRDSVPVTGKEGQAERDAAAVRGSGYHDPKQR